MSKAHRVFAATATALMTLALAACAGGGSVMTVNGQSISRADLDSKLEANPAARGVLQQIVQDMLLEQYAKDHNIAVSDDEVAKKEDSVKANFPAGSWDEMLKARNLSEDDVHKVLREQIIIDKAVGGDVKITDAQIQDYFNKNHQTFDTPDQVRARHILVSDLATANKIEGLLKQGGDFAALAKQYSLDPGTKDKGGELGFFRHGQMVPSFDAYAFSGKIGANSGPIKSPFGYHIIQVEERQTGKKATLADAHDRIVDTLRGQQEQPLIGPFLQKLQSQATIVATDPRFEGIFPTPPPAAPATSPAPSATK